MLNHITIMGRLTRDPELRHTGSGTPVASFTIACDRDFGGQDGQKETDFIDCVAWRGTGKTVAKYFTKGRMIVVSGRLQIRSWTDKDGNKRRTAEIVADYVYFGDSKPEGSNQGGNYNNAPAPGGYNAPANSYQQPSYGGAQQSYGTPAPETFPGYPSPAASEYSMSNPGYPAASEYPMLEGDDGELPF